MDHALSLLLERIEQLREDRDMLAMQLRCVKRDEQRVNNAYNDLCKLRADGLIR